MSDIVLHDISKSYRNHPVFSHLNLLIPQNKVTVITGESGSGKTTLFRLLMDLEKTDSGTITGLENKKISVLFQEDRLLENLSVSRNLRLALSLTKDNRKVIVEEIRQDLKEAGLEGIEEKTVRELSGGMKRRVSLIRSLLIHADIYFFDEASNGLDEENKERILRLIVKKTDGKTVLYITHDPEEAVFFHDCNVIHFPV